MGETAIDFEYGETVPVCSIAESFGVTEHQAHKLLLAASNKNTNKIMHYANGIYFVSNEAHGEIMSVDRRLKDRIFDLEVAVNCKSKSVPIMNGYAVYFLWDGNLLVYIGQTSNLLSRIGTHINDGKVFDSASVFPVSKEEVMAVEAVNIMAYKPSYNKSVMNPEEYLSLVLRMSEFKTFD